VCVTPLRSVMEIYSPATKRCASPRKITSSGDAAAGHELARLWCSSCHFVDGSGRGSDTAPPFATIAQNNRDNQGWLRWLKSPHPPMPNFNLSRQQIDDIVAHLGNLSSQSLD